MPVNRQNGTIPLMVRARHVRNAIVGLPRWMPQAGGGFGRPTKSR
jgi:hypothetical protein